MSQDPVYPVGLIYVGASNEDRSAILPVGEGDGKTPIVPDVPPSVLPVGVTIKQEKIDPEEEDVPPTTSADNPVEVEPWDSNIQIKEEDKSGGDSLPVVTSVYSTAGNEKESSQDKDTSEDRNSESYWEKRKKFTLAFAAGLRKFIQMHPELLKYGSKDEKPSVGGEIAKCENCVACLRTDDCGKCPICLDLSKFGARSKTRRICILRTCLHSKPKEDAMEESSSAAGNSSSGSQMYGKRKSRSDDAAKENSPNKRGRSNDQSSEEEESHENNENGSTSYVLPPEVTIKEEPPDSE